MSRRLLACALLMTLSFSLIPGCAWVHDRQALWPNRLGRAGTPRQAARDQPPKIELSVDPAPAPEAPEDPSR